MYSYSPVGDITIIAICFAMIVLICFSFVRKSRSFKTFLAILGVILLAASADVVMYMLSRSEVIETARLSIFVRCFYHSLLGLLFVLFTVYICEVTQFHKKIANVYLSIAWVIFAASTLTEVIFSIVGFRTPQTGSEALSYGRNIFAFGYVAFLILIVIMLIAARKRIYIRILLGFYGTITLSLAVLLVQVLLKNASYTVVSFMFPVLAMFYTMHSNPYNAKLGAVDVTAFEAFVKETYEAGKSFVYLSLYMKAFAEDNAVYPEALQESIRVHGSNSFRHTLLFRLGKGHVVMCAVKERNKDYKERVEASLVEFQKEYDRFQFDYKLVVGESMDIISAKNEYLSFINDILESMEENTVHFVDENDIVHYDRSEQVRKLLEDIYKKQDLLDPRVLVYCQPVYNINKKQYDTAEALMRLNLDGEVITPNLFIPVAEKNGYIHMLTEIILNKTCKEMKRMLDEGYDISRISVNVSAIELKEESFTEDISRIIKESRIPEGKIAIELTESQTDSDFRVMQRKINELKDQGIKFYLDDFGTGYSNMNRILELPFDIIKFDRSLVISCTSSEKARLIVVSLANIFAAMNYAVLYEGVENDSEVQMCAQMSASYLQGFLFSKPVPIFELRNYFTRTGKYLSEK